MKDSTELYEKAEKDGLISGDFAYLSLACSGRTQRLHYTREDLPGALREAEENMALMLRTKDALSTLQVSQTRHPCLPCRSKQNRSTGSKSSHSLSRSLRINNWLLMARRRNGCCGIGNAGRVFTKTRR